MARKTLGGKKTKPKKRNVKRILNIFAVLFVIAGGVLLLLVTAFRAGIFERDALIQHLVTLFTNSDDWRIEITGDIETRGVFRPHLRLEGLIISTSDEEKPWQLVSHIGVVEARIGLWSLLKGDIAFDKLTFDEGDLHLSLDHFSYHSLLPALGIVQNGIVQNGIVETNTGKEVEKGFQDQFRKLLSLLNVDWELNNWEVRISNTKDEEKEVRFKLKQLKSTPDVHVDQNWYSDRHARSWQAMLVQENDEPIVIDAVASYPEDQVGPFVIDVGVSLGKNEVKLEATIPMTSDAQDIQSKWEISITEQTDRFIVSKPTLDIIFGQESGAEKDILLAIQRVLTRSEGWSLKMDVTGHFNDFSVAGAQFRSNFPDGGRIELDGRLTSWARQEGLYAALHIEGQTPKDVLSYLGKEITLSSRYSKVAESPFLLTLSVNSVAPGSYEVDIQELFLDDNQVSGRLRVTRDEDMFFQVVADLNSESLNLTPYLWIESGDDDDSPVTAPDPIASSNDEGDTRSEDGVEAVYLSKILSSAELSLRIASIQLLEKTYEHGLFKLKWSDGLFKEVYLEDENGKITLTWPPEEQSSAQAKDPALRAWMIHMVMEQMDSSLIQSLLHLPRYVLGPVHLDGIITGSSKQDHLMVEEGHLKVKSSLESIRFSSSEAQAILPFGSVFLELLEITCLDGDVHVEKGVILVKDLQFLALGSRWGVQGIVDKIGNHISLTLSQVQGDHFRTRALLRGEIDGTNVYMGNTGATTLREDLQQYGFATPITADPKQKTCPDHQQELDS